MKAKRLFIAFVLLASAGGVSGQSPTSDPNWVLNTSKSDEFTTFDVSKWQKLDLWGGVGYNWGGNSRFRSANTSIVSNELELKVESPFGGATVPYDFSECCNTGGIWSVDFDYSYGYFEIYAKFPGFTDGTGLGHGYRFWPAFWLYDNSSDHTSGPNVPPACSHFEIDISDPGGNQYEDANIFSGNGWYSNNYTPCDGSNHEMGIFFSHETSVNLCDGYHKYAVEWNSDRVIFYFDDEPVSASYNNPDFVWPYVRVVIDQQIDGGCPLDFHAGTTFPQYMKIDYFRYYTLNKDCSNDATILDNTALASFTYAIKRNITFSNNINNVSFSSGQKKTFRATDAITVYGNFTVPYGAEVTLMPTPCN